MAVGAVLEAVSHYWLDPGFMGSSGSWCLAHQLVLGIISKIVVGRSLGVYIEVGLGLHRWWER